MGKRGHIIGTGKRKPWNTNVSKASKYFTEVELRGFEPLTFSMPLRRATNCAIAPKYENHFSE